MAEQYRHYRALVAVRKAEERYAVELRRRGLAVCEWCGQPIPIETEGKRAEERAAFAEFVRRFAEDPKGWEALAIDYGTPGLTEVELAKTMRVSKTTAHRARERAKRLAQGLGLARPPALAAGEEAGGVVGTTEGGRAG